MPLLLVIAAAAALAFLVQSADQAGRALWPIVVALLLAFAAFALAMWHRRQMAHLHQLHLVVVGRYANVNAYRPWPKYCTDCGQTIESWRQAAAHDDPATSPCMKLRAANDAIDAVPGLPMAGYTAEVLGETAGDESSPGPDITDPKARSKAIVERLKMRGDRA